MVLLVVPGPALHDEGAEGAELEEVEDDEDDGAHRHQDRQEPHQVAGCMQ